ncbi:unnamed protein product [Urochloa decumbens]|uniref:Protein kinase domain-containing protein n=1 Tax=Urochloa decumbens TaxID=240449 RepID=A0ABC8VAW5_9POAL
MGGAAFLSLLLITTSMAYSSTDVAAARPATAKSRDATAIADFTNHLSNPPPSWVHGGDVCSGNYVGIQCDRYGWVTGINLTDMGLSGTLTSSVSTLRALEFLELGGNRLTGAIPSLAGMVSLTRLVLRGNGFTSVPFDFFNGLTSLMYLDMDDLPLEPWVIPDAIGECTELQLLSASNVSITGELPATLVNLKSLAMLWLSYNYITGSLPPWIAKLRSLEIVGLHCQKSDVKISGKLDVFASLKNMKQLWVQSNSITGAIPNFNSAQLLSLNVSDNMLTGLVPTSLMRLKILQSVGLSKNFLQGPWPVFPTGVAVDMGSGNRFCLPSPGPCDGRVSILLDVAGGFGFPLELAQTWAGNDPCIGNWIGIVCRNNFVVEINLSGKNLSGFMSSAFANLSMLERLDLSENQLKGVIPVALTTLRNLRILNVSSNNLPGQIPRFKSSVQVFAEGNHLSFRNSLSKAQMIGIIIGSILLVVILVLLAGLCMCYLKKKNDASEPASPTHLSTQQVITGTTHSPRHSVSADSGCHSVSLVDKLKMNVLMKATNNFDESSVIGRGGTAVVFKGTLNGQDVAIKRFNSSTMGAEQVKGFNLEIEVLGKLNHRNVVKLLGYCVHNTERLLVYEYMSSGTLREHLQPSDRHAPLTWMQRVKISLDVAQGIDYLHGLSHEKLIHRDLKPSNILLDQNLTAKISDFGLVRLSEDKSSTSKTVGTYGYMAPEYASFGTLGSEIDVYSYGVILMEIITGRKAINESLSQDDVFLVPIFRTLVKDKEKLRDIVDPTLELNGEDWNNLKEVADYACYCTEDEPKIRPNMRTCVLLLSDIVDKYQPIVIGSDQGETSGMGKRLNEVMQDWVKDIPTTSGSDN